MTTMTAEVAYTSDTAARQGWDEVDRTLLMTLRRSPATLKGIADTTGFPPAIVDDAVLGYQLGGLVRRHIVHYELTLAGWARLAQLTSQTTVPATRKAA